MASADEELQRIRDQYGVEIEDDNADKLRRLETDEHSNESFEDYLSSLEEKQKLRARPTFSAGGIGGDDDRDGDGRADSGSGPQSVTNSWNSDDGGGGVSQRERDPRIDDLYARLLADSQKEFDRNDPAIRAQVDAFSANKTRASRNYLGDIAEQAGPLANIRGEQRMASERLGQQTGEFEAQTYARELSAHRDQITQRLAAMQGLLSFEEENALRMQLAELDAQLKREGMALQGRGMDMDNDQFLQSMALNDWDRRMYYSPTNPWLYQG